jgi:Tannase and feruloyl esterase
MRILPFVFALLFSVSSAALANGQPSGTTQHGDPAKAAADRCERLAKLDVPNATITMAKTVSEGTFAGPPQAFTGADQSAFYKKLPAFCRVVVQAHPTTDSNITIEVWMPLAGWNGRLQGLGNGGFAGLIDYFELGAAMSKGYAATATDAGHAGSPVDATWALGHPEKIIDFGHRGIHEMTRVAKVAAQQFYGSAPAHAYFAGCSDGGREALMEAQRYPGDYDGIVAGAPANYWTALLSSSVVDTQALTATPASFVSQAKIPAIANAVLAACDERDGVRDGILNDPRQCRFDPASIQCKNGEDTEKCLTGPQVVAIEQIYAGLKDGAGHTLFPGYLPGAEEGGGGWGVWITGPAPARSLMALFGLGYFSNMVYGKDWDYKSFALESGMKTAREKTAAALDAVDPDLAPFRSRGGKLILYHGWNDPAIPAVNTVNYYEGVVTRLGQANTDSFVRLYMLPGVQHCDGGPGADTFGQSASWTSDEAHRNVRTALQDWVEKGAAPETLIATRPAAPDPQGSPAMTRPLCPYPQSARFKGNGNPNNAESFECAGPGK